ncbi:MAG: tyrosine-type recombinase/integrase [Verrucomicrobia bacterium]|jgi:integrase/recombinase XerD|nr:tyrosine-type recombinase/integrase [Verrucomicrobiota bacterium]MBT7702092.1 tyrosine-type recombinase/integrase [Verrucomicrobiota bacterium]
MTAPLCYPGGRPYFGLRSTVAGQPRRRNASNNRVISLTSSELGWARFWEIVSGQLNQHAYSETSHELYRSVLRGFYKRTRCAPAAVTDGVIRDHLNSLVAEHYSWNWIGMNISVLRTVFDKLGGQTLTHRFATPKRPQHLPEILSLGEVGQILAAATTTRDQLLLGLMYGCGLKVSEACRLSWADIDTARETLCVRYARGTRQRTLPIPPDLIPVLKAGHERCPSTDYIFQGRTQGTHLSTRMAQLILRSAVKATDIIKPVTCMTLRHSFAVHCLENGDSVRALQEALGHKSIDTTLVYEDCILPPCVASPLDRLKQQAHTQTAEPDPLPCNPASCETLPGPQPRGAKLFPVPHPRGAKHFARLFTRPLSVDALELPFRDNSRVERSSLRDETSGSRAGEFYRQLKTHIFGLSRVGQRPLRGRFLGSRRSTIRAG